jgi:hypothetical protein
VLGAALEVLKTENSIVADVCQDVDVNSLVDRYGFF